MASLLYEVKEGIGWIRFNKPEILNAFDAAECRRLVEVLVDFALVTGSYVGAHLLRFEGTLSPDIQALVIQSLPIVLLVKLTC